MAVEVPVRVRLVEVFADVWCPFTYVGLRRLGEERRRRGRHDVVVRVRAWPLELVNGEPLGANLVGEEIQALRARVAPELFGGFDPGRFPSTTLPALALAAAAYHRDPRTGERVSLALRTALFEEGRDLSDPGQLGAIATAAGVDLPDSEAEAWVLDDWQEGRRRGVIGSPHFFVDDDGFFCPTLSIRRVDDHLRISTDPEGFAAFVDAAFGAPQPAEP
jgi:predicted DsbA family dithiol-disulfide isomerase